MIGIRRALRSAICGVFLVQLSGCCCCDPSNYEEFSEGFAEGFEEGMQEELERQAAERAEQEARARDKTKKSAGVGGKFQTTSFAAASVPKSIPTKGKIVDGVRFQDKNGDNFLVLSTAGQDLHAVHAVVDGPEVKTLRTVKQVRGKCEFDYMSGFEPRATKATDLDGDGYGEATFAYRYTCTSDISPWTYKLLVLENGEKAILRGSDIVDVGGGDKFGDGKFEPEGFGGKSGLLEHAEKIWKATVVQK